MLCSQIAPLLIPLFSYASSSPITIPILDRDTTNFFILEIETHLHTAVVSKCRSLVLLVHCLLLSFLGILAAYTALPTSE